MNNRVARASTLLQTAWLALLSLLLAARYLWVYRHHPLSPASNQPATAWFGWADQAAYFLAAHGWASGNLDPSQHLYPAGYALLGALFVWLTPADPFVVPDLLCWVASLWLFASLGARLAGQMPGSRVTAATIFFLIEVVDLHALYTWEIPWTSTPAATLTFASLLLAIRHADEADRWSGLAAALLAGTVALFRPTDAMVVMPAAAVSILATTWLSRTGWRGNGKFLIAVAGAFAVGPLLLAATHLATHGWALGRYFTNSSLVGFEWRLLPLRWVTLLLSPKPLYPAGSGFAAVYWFVLPGLAGIAAAIAADRGRRLRHVVVGGAAVVFLCLYLCYRDLLVQGLFTFENQHYFKWTLPVFAFYALGLLYFLFVRREFVVCATAAAFVMLLSCWRAQLDMVLSQPAATVLADGRGLALPHGLSGLDDAVLASAPDDFLAQYFGSHVLEADGRRFMAGSDFKVVPVPFGLMVIPLRPLPDDPSQLRLADPIRLTPSAAVLTARQTLVFGLPCFIAPHREACRFKPVLAPPWSKSHT